MAIKNGLLANVWLLFIAVGIAAGEAPTNTTAYAKVQALERKLATLAVRSDHPRIYLNAENLSAYRARMSTHPSWANIRTAANSGDMVSAAFCYQILRQSEPAAAAIYSSTAIARVLTGGGLPPDRALAFDWTYEAMTADQRTAAINELAAAAGLAVPPTKPISQFVFHSEEWAGDESSATELYPSIALAGHAPNAAEYYLAHFRDRDSRLGDAARYLAYLGGTWAAEGGYWISRSKWHTALKIFLPLKTATGVNIIDDPSHPYFDAFGTYCLYVTDAVNKKIWFGSGDGETAFPISTYSDQLRKVCLAVSSQKHSPYQNWLLTNIMGYKPAFDTIDGALLYDHTVGEKTPSVATWAELPLTKGFFPEGLILMRSGWGPSDCMASFSCTDVHGRYQHHHQPGDINNFTIYKNGGVLVPDGGYYASWGDDHHWKYFVHGVAHNTISIYDPAETYGWGAAGFLPNDGGPRPPYDFSNTTTFSAWKDEASSDCADFLFFRSEPLWDAMAGDATRAYSGTKASEVSRALVFIRRAKGYVVIFDRVHATNAGFKKRWMLHLNGEPTISGTKVSSEVAGHIETYDGALAVSQNLQGTASVHCRRLLPRDGRIRKVGGSGYEFWNFDNLNHPPSAPTFSGNYENGRWRIEVSPTTTAQRDYFLHVLYLGETGETMVPVDLVEEDSRCGASWTDGDMSYKITFDKIGPLNGYILIRQGTTTIVDDGFAGGSGNSLPVITAQAAADPTTAVVGQAVYFSIAAMDPDGDSITFAWDFGDGHTADGTTSMHTYSSPGVYVVTATVDDGRGGRANATIQYSIADPGGDIDTDGDGVNDVQEIVDGTDPFNSNSVNRKPLLIATVRGKVGEVGKGRDWCSLIGMIPNMPGGFSPSNAAATLDIGGARVAFQLDARGRAKNRHSVFTLTLKPIARRKGLKSTAFSGGDVLFKARVCGDWASPWQDIGMNLSAPRTTRVPLCIPVSLNLCGMLHSTLIDVVYSSFNGRGKFKK